MQKQRRKDSKEPIKSRGIQINDQGNFIQNENPFKPQYTSKIHMTNDIGGDRFSFDPTPHLQKVAA